jgi:hypothetical protein
MEKIIFLFLLLLISNLSYSQVNTLNHFELKDIIFDVSRSKKFIKDDFVVFAATQTELLEMNHPIRINNFNRVVKNDKIKFTLFGMPVKGLYGYTTDSEHYCLYLLIKIDRKGQINGFMDELGKAWNITVDDYATGDFDMLLWDKYDLKISLMRNFDDYKLLTITNLPLHDLINNSPW